jgi:hypothetical protein
MKCPSCKKKLAYIDETKSKCSNCGWNLRDELKKLPEKWEINEKKFRRSGLIATVELRSYFDEWNENLDETTPIESPYYLLKWIQLNQNIKKTDFNFSAWLTGFIWIVYRKNVKLAILYYIIENIVIGLILQLLKHYNIQYLLIIIYGFIRLPLGFYANMLYLKWATKNIIDIQNKNVNNENEVEKIKKIGGKSSLNVVFAIILNILISLVIFMF